jgi:carboxymethylenebutenolidase
MEDGMADEGKKSETSPAGDQEISRRGFAALSLAAGLVAATNVSAAQMQVVETAVDVRTPDGVADGYLYHPQGAGTWPAVIMYPDAFAVRPAFRDMARRLSATGYTVLLPNFFYRSGRTPVMKQNFDFANADDRAFLDRLRAPLTPEAVARDAVAYIAFLSAQPSVRRAAKIGTQGYCMSGPFAIRTAAAAPDRVGAVASFHGGGLVTNMPDSPHLLIGKTRANYYIGIAASDDMQQPDAKDKLRAALQAAHLPGKVEVYEGALHGWCVKDMPLQQGQPIYNEALAERAWTNLLGLYKTALV